LRPKLLSHQCYRGYTKFGEVYAVTHGAGSAGASVPVGGDDTHAIATNLAE